MVVFGDAGGEFGFFASFVGDFLGFANPTAVGEERCGWLERFLRHDVYYIIFFDF